MLKVLYVIARPTEINTSASVRNKATIQGLVSIGCEVDLITTEPDRNHPAYDESMVVTNVRVMRIKLGGAQKIAKIGRRFKLLKPIRDCVASIMAKKNIYDNLVGIVNHVGKISIHLEKYDYIISSSDPKSSHLFVYELLKNRKEFTGRWIQIWGDPFVGDITLQNKNVSKIRKEECKLLSAADSVVYVSKLTLLEQMKNYTDSSKKMRCLPIPYVEKRIYGLRNLKTVDVIEIAYCGDYLSSVRDILPLYECINALSNIHLTICGMSDLKLDSTEKVTIFPRVSREKVLEIEEKADILVHLSNRKGTQIPGKIYQYAGTNKPILFILDGCKEKLIENFGRYQRFVFSENNFSSLKLEITNIIQQEEQYGPVDAFSPEYIANEIIR